MLASHSGSLREGHDVQDWFYARSSYQDARLPEGGISAHALAMCFIYQHALQVPRSSFDSLVQKAARMPKRSFGWGGPGPLRWPIFCLPCHQTAGIQLSSYPDFICGCGYMKKKWVSALVHVSQATYA